ncbi:ankyrin repeat-containing domain protein, partial [Chytridium lagenaria]
MRYTGVRLLFAACWVGISPLHMAAIGGDVDVASILLAADADVDAQDGEQRTPIFLAVTYNNLEIVRLLLDHGANASIAEGGTQATG